MSLENDWLRLFVLDGIYAVEVLCLPTVIGMVQTKSIIYEWNQWLIYITRSNRLQSLFRKKRGMLRNDEVESVAEVPH
jgi:hypothetical protein